MCQSHLQCLNFIGIQTFSVDYYNQFLNVLYIGLEGRTVAVLHANNKGTDQPGHL